MRTLKHMYYLVVLMLLIPAVLILRLFGWRPAGDTGIQTLFQREPKGTAIVSGEDTDTEPCPYVYINADGSARELHRSEREYLEIPFHGADGGRPYVKWRYLQKNGWGEIKGFLRRTKVPKTDPIGPAPVEDPQCVMTRDKHIQFLREKGLNITENGDGSFTAAKPRMFRTDL
jgi:hypothetical protein